MELSKEKAKDNLKALIAKFEQETNLGKIGEYNEEATKTAFIQPFLKDVLGWDVNNRDEVSPEENVSRKRVDYGLIIDGKIKIFVEAKPPKADLNKHIEQAVNYGYNRRTVPFVLLTDFEGLKLFDATIKPDYRNYRKGLKIDLTWDKYLTNFDDIWILRKESAQNGEIDKLIKIKSKDRILVDMAILEDLKKWQENLAKDIFKNNPQLFKSGDRDKDAQYLREITQRLLDRLIFMRFCEDRRFIHRTYLKPLFDERSEAIGTSTMVLLRDEFKHYNNIFNSDLFRPQDWEADLLIDFKIMYEIIMDTYNPYQFDVISLEILGNIYEQYLGYTIRLTDQQVKYELKPDIRKAGGVYYTPEYIVDYIVNNTVGTLQKEYPIRKIKKLRILDPACGSGSFLIRAYDAMLNWYKLQKKEKVGNSNMQQTESQQLFEQQDQDHILSIGEKAQILRDHIFGVDIDEQAVEVTKLSLMLKMLEGEFGIIPGSHLLPMLDKNIKCGNSLISGDTFELMKSFGKDYYKLKPFAWKDQFNNILINESGFDVVIGNPPYRKERESKILIKEIKESQLGQMYYEGKMDLWFFFLHRGLEVAKINGLISFIVPSYWLMGTGSKKLIMHIKNDGKINFLLNFNKNKIFKEVGGRHLIFNISKKQMTNNYNFKVFDFVKSELNESELKTSIAYEKDVKKINLNSNDVFYDGKIMLSRTDILKQIKESHVDLNTICEVSQGIVEATDRIGNKMLMKAHLKQNYKVGQGIFVLSNSELEKIRPNQKERLFLKRYLDADEVSRYYCKWNHNYVWYVGNKENKYICKNKDEFKNMVAYFDSIQQFITSSNKPYGIHRTRQKYFFEKPKLFCKNMIDYPCFTYCDEELYVNLSFNVVINRNNKYSLKYILGIINSNFGAYWFNSNAKKRGFNIDIGVSVMRKFPIRKIDFNHSLDKKHHDDIIALVDIMLDLNKKYRIVKGGEKEQIQRQIEQTDNEINNLVYKLYGISKEEIIFIEKLLC